MNDLEYNLYGSTAYSFTKFYWLNHSIPLHFTHSPFFFD